MSKKSSKSKNSNRSNRAVLKFRADSRKPYVIIGHSVQPREFPSILAAGLSMIIFENLETHLCKDEDVARKVVFHAPGGVVDVTESARWEARRFLRLNPSVDIDRAGDIVDAANLFPAMDETARVCKTCYKIP